MHGLGSGLCRDVTSQVEFWLKSISASSTGVESEHYGRGGGVPNGSLAPEADWHGNSAHCPGIVHVFIFQFVFDCSELFVCETGIIPHIDG